MAYNGTGFTVPGSGLYANIGSWGNLTDIETNSFVEIEAYDNTLNKIASLKKTITGYSSQFDNSGYWSGFHNSF